MGAPGAGKGTQAGAVAQRYSIPAISTGEMFRRSVASGTDLGKRVGEIIAAGEFVSDELTEQVVADRLDQPDAANGWLLDGFPRTMHQVGALDGYLAERSQELDGVIYLNVPSELLVARLVARGRAEGRADDTIETIQHRMDVFVEQTEPLLDAYDRRGILVQVDGDASIEEVNERIHTALTILAASKA